MSGKEKTEKYRTLSQNLSPKASRKLRKLSTGSSFQDKTSSENKITRFLPELSNKRPKNNELLLENKQSTKEIYCENKSIKKEPELESIEESKNVKTIYLSRYINLIKSIQDNNKQKALQKEQEELKIKKKKEKLKDELGLTNIKSKLSGIPQEDDQNASENKVEKPLNKVKNVQQENEIPIT